MVNTAHFPKKVTTHQQYSGFLSEEIDATKPLILEPSAMMFCKSCGNVVSRRVPKGDHKQRIVCNSCGLVHSISPKIVVGCIPRYMGKVLLCQRAIEPQIGCWTLPAGFMENGETTCQGAARETWEEAKARVSDLELYRVLDAPYIDQVFLIYRCVIDHGSFGVGGESLDTALYKENDVPWQEMAFPAVSKVLKEYFADCRDGYFPVRASTLFDGQCDD